MVLSQLKRHIGWTYLSIIYLFMQILAWMDTPITKRLIISGLTTSITANDISQRLTTFGTVKASDGFGLTDGLGQPRKFGYVTLETTTGKLAKCMTALLPSSFAFFFWIFNSYFFLSFLKV
jgi:hypothetical protein